MGTVFDALFYVLPKLDYDYRTEGVLQRCWNWQINFSWNG